jgi:hypothetical protein
MQRQSSISEVASYLGITESAVSECIDSGLFLSTTRFYEDGLVVNCLDKQECEWAWLQFTNQIAGNPNVSQESLSRAVAYVKSLRILILEAGSYFEGINLMKGTKEEDATSPSIGVQLVIAVLLFIVIFLSFT